MEGGSKMIDINVTLLIQMANFLVFLLLMNFVLYRPIRKAVAERKKLIADKQAGIEELEAQVRAALLAYDQGLHDARRTGAQRIQELKAAGYDEEKELLRRSSEQTASQVQELRGKIKEDIATAQKELKQQIKTFAVDLAQKILGRKI
jgi:F-type H+-transporting ATPase subunit b